MSRLMPLLVLAAMGPQEEGRKVKQVNRLSKEKSPYLLQHAHNPVDWYPWGAEAFEKARREGKPIFLSIGYSTCHWCHVMERESFEDEEVAGILNEGFVSIKVDREERPEVDRIYMTFVQASTGHGGWPLSVWLTPEREPFIGGTYFPKEDVPGRSGFKGILRRIVELWKTQREEIEDSAGKVVGQLRRMAASFPPGEIDPDRILERGATRFAGQFDPGRGGFSKAPKFPSPMTIRYLLRRHHRTGEEEPLAMSEKTLLEMARGGIYDQLGGGFHRYATDAEWLVPHFEKMLYDNALLAVAYLEAYQLTGKVLYARIARETLEYVLRDLTSKEGAFFSAEDADSEGVEGRFYVWSPAQVREVLGEEEGLRFCRAFDVTERGNWEPLEESIPKGQSVLRVVREGDFEASRRKLFEARSKRVRPFLDDKVLTSWNALMISALCSAARVLEEPRYQEAAVRAARYLLGKHLREGRVLRTSRHGAARLDGCLEDYAALAAAMLDLYETTFEASWVAEAGRLVERACGFFWDAEAGGFFVTSERHDSLIVRLREDYEGPIPSGNALMAMTLLRLHAYTGSAASRDWAVKTLESFRMELERMPDAFPYLLCVVDFFRGPSRQIVVTGPRPGPLLRVVRRTFLPNAVVALAEGKPAFALLEGRDPVGGRPAAYVCRDMACELPVTDPGELEALLRR